MLRKPHSERGCICQITTDGNPMEREVLHSVWVYTTPHRTLHGTQQHKQELGWIRSLWNCAESTFPCCISELCTQKDTSGCTQHCNLKQQNGKNGSQCWKSSTIGSLLLEGKKMCSFSLLLVKTPKEKTNQKPKPTKPKVPTNHK